MKTIARNALLALICGLQGLMSCANAAPAPAPAPTAAGPMPPTVTYANCSWDHPGINPFMGEVVAAVDRYQDIPPEVRTRLKERMAKREYDDLVSIQRDSIIGRGGYDYGSTITEMHFGTHQLCHSVTRTSWTPTMEERGLVYCESGQCILVPTVCRNVSRITRSGVGNDAAAAPPMLAAPPAAAPPTAGSLPPIEWFGPTGAGVPMGGGAVPGDAPVDAAPAAWADLWPPAPIVMGGAIGGLLPGTNAGPGATGSNAFGTAVPGSVFGSDGGPRSVDAVPEPQIWVLMLFGAAAVWVVARRQRGDPASTTTEVTPRATALDIFL